MKIKKLISDEVHLKPTKPKSLGTMVDDTAMGIEVELENCPAEMGRGRVFSFQLHSGPVIELQRGINAHVDGSLRNNGLELVTPPFRGEDVDWSVAYMLALAKQHNWVASNRAGIHIHMDVQQLEIPQLINVLATYTLVEPALFNWIGEGRQGSIFCKAWTDDYISDSLTEYVAKLREIEADEEAGALWRIRTRYIGCNLESIAKYGTLEFRHMRTTLDTERVLKWCRMLQMLRAYGANHQITEDTLKNYGSASILEAVFGPTLGRELNYGEFDSYYNLRSIPLCSQVFLKPPKGKPNWMSQTVVKKTGTHVGFTKFTKDKSAPKVDEDIEIAHRWDPVRGLVQVATPHAVPNTGQAAVERLRDWRFTTGFNPIRQAIEDDVMTEFRVGEERLNPPAPPAQPEPVRADRAAPRRRTGEDFRTFMRRQRAWEADMLLR